MKNHPRARIGKALMRKLELDTFFKLLVTTFFLSLLASIVFTGAFLGSSFLPQLIYLSNKADYQPGTFQVESVFHGKTGVSSYRGSGKKLKWAVRGFIQEQDTEQKRWLNAFDFADYQTLKEQNKLTSFLNKGDEIPVYFVPEKYPFNLNSRDLYLIDQQTAKKVTYLALLQEALIWTSPWLLVIGCILIFRLVVLRRTSELKPESA